MNPHGLQIFSLGAAIVLLVMVVAVAVRRPRFRLLMVPPLSMAVLVIVFYAGVLTHWLPSGDTALFISAVLRAVELVIVIGGLISLLVLTNGHDE